MSVRNYAGSQEPTLTRSGCRRVLIAFLLLTGMAPSGAATLRPLHRFTDTGSSTPSGYALGSTPYSELIQASDGNFYGTTQDGGTGGCAIQVYHTVPGCGTVFRITPQGQFTVIYSFPYDATAGTAANGAFPTAGLIQGKDGYLYGVAQDGGISRCNGVLGCGTMFRISITGSFKLLHQFCSGDGCPSGTEGGRPMAHLVQTPSGTLCGTTAEGGYENEGTLFCATTGGSVNTLYDFMFENGTDGYQPVAALLVGKDGQTLYGTTTSRGVNGGGTLFAFKGGVLTNLYSFSTAPGACYTAQGALIFGADGDLYGTTSSGGSGGGCIFSLATDGTGYSTRFEFLSAVSSNAPGDPYAGLVLARDGMMYGTTLFGSVEQTYGLDNGVLYRFNPTNNTFKSLADFNGTVGAMPYSALIEGSDNYLYGTAPLYGGSNKRGEDAGTIVRLSPALKQ